MKKMLTLCMAAMLTLASGSAQDKMDQGGKMDKMDKMDKKSPKSPKTRWTTKRPAARWTRWTTKKPATKWTSSNFDHTPRPAALRPSGRRRAFLAPQSSG